MIWSQLGQHWVDTDLFWWKTYSTLYFNDDFNFVPRGVGLGGVAIATEVMVKPTPL
jgi:hypothetical protein